MIVLLLWNVNRAAQ